MLKVNEYGGRQAKGNEKRQCFKGWETLVILLYLPSFYNENENLHHPLTPLSYNPQLGNEPSNRTSYLAVLT